MNLKHDVYTITNIMILRIVIILFLKLKDIKKPAPNLVITPLSIEPVTKK